MRAGEHRTLADELEVAPGQQRVAGHPVFRDEKRVPWKLRFEALIGRVGAHSLGGRLKDIVTGQPVLVVGPDLEDARAVDIFWRNYGPSQETELVLMARHVRMRVESQTPNRLPFHVVGRVL